MTTRSILTVVGTVVGSYFGYPQLGAFIGSIVGAAVEPDPPTQYGPRLEDRRVQISTYGLTVPVVRGAVRLAGNVFWSKDLEEVATEDEVGGKGGPTQSQVIYSYYGTFAVLLCKGPIRGFRRIWADSVLIFDSALVNPSGVEIDVVFYPGDEEQLPDPTIEADKGVDNTPAYRGYCYIVFNRLPLERYGNRLPSITVELVGEGEFTPTEVLLPLNVSLVSPEGHSASTQLDDGSIATLSVFSSAGETGFRINVYDPTTGELLRSTGSGSASTWNHTNNITYVPPLGELWVSGWENTVHRYSAETLAFIGNIENEGITGRPQVLYDNVQRSVLWRNSFHLTAGGENVVLAGAISVTDVLESGLAGHFHLDGTIQFETMGAIIASVPIGLTGRGCFDLRRRRYVLVQGSSIYTVTDEIPPVITNQVVPDFISYSLGTVFYDLGTDCVLVMSQTFGQVEVVILDAGTFEILFDSGAGGFDPVSALGVTDAWGYQAGELVIVGNDQDIWRMPFFSSTVGAAVAELCNQSGLQPADYDVSELTARLRGYLISQFAPARGAVDQLAKVFLFECTEQDDQLYFRARGGASVATITADECGTGIDQAETFPISKTRTQEADLPRLAYVTAPDPLTDFQTGTQYAAREVSIAGSDAQLQVAVVMNADDCRRLAYALLFDAWASRERRAWSTTRKHARLVPTDVIALDGERVRILTRSDEGAVIRFEGVIDDPDVIEQYIAGVQGEFPRQIIAIVVPTTLYILDIALLTDQENYPGAYIAAYGPPATWRGAVLFGSSDSGTTWERECTLPAPGAAVGATGPGPDDVILIDGLSNWTGGNVFDEANAIQVSIYNGELASTTRQGVFNGENVLAIQTSVDFPGVIDPDATGVGWEIVQFRDAELLADGTYLLRGLLRGRRGTQFAMAYHAIGERVVALTPTTIQDMQIDSDEIGVSRRYRAVSIGDSLGETDEQLAVVNAERLKPWSPVHLGGGRDHTGDLFLKWVRRTRVGGEWRDLVDASLGEASEEYTVEIFLNASRLVILRTVTGITSPSYTYTAADQTTDFASPQSTVYWRVTQISETVGPGHPADGTT